MSDSVSPFSVASTTPDQTVVDELEELLALARSGELRGIAFVGYLTARNIRYGFFGTEMTGQYLRTHGLLMWLAGHAMRKWDSECAVPVDNR